jgi:hypothetical protein
MNNNDKRGRGRPIGTGKDDSYTLSRVADLIAANPALRPTTAIKRVLDTLDPSIIRRLQVKWRAGKDEHLAQARSRRAVAVGPAHRSNSSYSPRTARQLAAAHRAMHDALGGSHLASIQAALNDPGLRAMREAMSSPGMLAMQEAMRRHQENPAMRAIQELQNSPTMRAIRELQDSPTMRAMRDLQTKLGGLY